MLILKLSPLLTTHPPLPQQSPPTNMGSLQPGPHFVIFPFMSQGHIIPLLRFAGFLLRRRPSTTVTILTTPANAPLITASLPPGATLLQIPFPTDIPGVPAGVENTHRLPSMAAFLPFVQSTHRMKPSLDLALDSLDPPPSCLISDMFLARWTLQSARRRNIPLLIFSGMSQFGSTMYQVLGMEKPHAASPDSLDRPFPMPGFDGVNLTRNDFEPPFNDVEPTGEYVDFIAEQVAAMRASHAVIVNSFYELESTFVEYWNRKIGPKAICVGPLCLAAPPPEIIEKPDYVQFLDEKLAAGEKVLYVAFGTQAEVTDEQFREIAIGLARSEVSFLWVLKSVRAETLTSLGFRSSRGLVVEDWVDQLVILNHGAVGGFLSHCGWNSVTESISAGVPMVAMPFMAEQHLNARLVVELACVGLRARPASGSVRGLVEAAEVERAVREVMAEAGDVQRTVAEVGAAARAAMADAGSSVRALDELIEEVNKCFSIYVE